jgi:hypothetical protein
LIKKIFFCKILKKNYFLGIYIEFLLNKHKFDDSDQKTGKYAIFEKKNWPKFQLFGP